MKAEEAPELVHAAAAGDREAFAELVRRHHPRVLRLCLSVLRDPAAADDAAAEAFLKAFERLAGFEARSSFATWLHRIALNQCLDLLRRRSRERSESLEEMVAREGEALRRLLAGPPGGQPGPADPSARLESEDLLERLLGTLPEEQRLALVLRESMGLSYQEIAEVLECSLDSVKARLRRARSALQEGTRGL